LSIAQNIKYGILEFSDITKIDDKSAIDAAAEYYYREINRVGKNQKVECISNTLILYNKLIDAYQKDTYISRRDSLRLLLKNKNSLHN
jgi:hypothetical protein